MRADAAGGVEAEPMNPNTITEQSPMITDERLAEIEARANAAPPGPWEIGGWLDPFNRWRVVSHGGNDVCYTQHPWLGEQTVAFVAHARTDTPDLIQEVRRLRALLPPVVTCPTCGEAFEWQEEASTCPHALLPLANLPRAL